MKKINIAAVITGVAVDIGGTFIFFSLLGFIAGFALAMERTPLDEINSRLYGSVLIQSIFLLLGLFFTAAGGFVTGLIAKQNRILNSFVMGCISFTAGLFFFVISIKTTPIWYLVLALLLTIPSSVIGGLLSLIIKKDASDSPLRQK